MGDDGIKTAKGHTLAIKDLRGDWANCLDPFIGHDLGIGSISSGAIRKNRPREDDGLIFFCRRSFIKPAAEVGAEIVGCTFRVLQRTVLNPDGSGLFGELAVFFEAVFWDGEEKDVDVGFCCFHAVELQCCMRC